SVAAVGLIAALVVYRRYGGGAALGAFSAGLAAAYLVIAVNVLPALDHYKSARAFCDRVLSTVGESPLAMYPDYHPTYVYYTGRFIPVLRDREELRRFLSAGRAYCLIEDDLYAAERRDLEPGVSVLDRQQIGHRDMLLIGAGGGPDRGLTKE